MHDTLHAAMIGGSDMLSDIADDPARLPLIGDLYALILAALV